MAFYHFLAIFPALLVCLALVDRAPELGTQVKHALEDLSSLVMPNQVAQLFQNMMDELSRRALSGSQFLFVSAGAGWASLNATWAMVYGLNRAYEVQENRSWRELGGTILGLTLGLAVTCCIAVSLIFSGSVLAGAHLKGGVTTVHILEWLVLIAALLFWFAVLYRFAPNLRDHEWRWSTPGAVCALILWVGSTFAARVYFERVDNYSRSYGHLNGVVMLLLWLYVTNGAILIGGEMNSEIEKAATMRDTIGVP